MESTFVKSCSSFLVSFATSAAVYFIEHPEITDPEELAASFCTKLNLGTPVRSILAPPSLGGAFPHMSGSFPGLGASVSQPPPGTGTVGAKKGRSKIEKPPQPWYTIPEYIQHIREGKKICGYNPPRDPHKEHVCGADVLTDETRDLPEHISWRCANCATKVGKIAVKLAASQGSAPMAAPGFQVPASRPPGIPLTRPGLPLARPSFVPPPMPRSLPAPAPVAPIEPDSIEVSVIERTGIKEFYFGNDADTMYFLLKRTEDSFVCIGKYTDSELPTSETPAPEDYEKFIGPLDDDEIDTCKKYGIVYETKKSAPRQLVPLVPMLPRRGDVKVLRPFKPPPVPSSHSDD
jgi:hypothetical protein